VHVDAAGIERSDAVHLAKFENAEQFRLECRRELADLVQKQRPAISEFKEARLVLCGAGKGAAHVPEQLAFKQRINDGRTADGHEPSIPARADLVKCARDQLLAGARLSRDQGRPHMRRQPPDHAEQLLHDRSATNHATELQAPRDVSFHRQQAAPPLRLFPNRRQQLIEPPEVKRLAQVIHRTQLDSFNRGLDCRVTGHQHRLTARIHIADRPDHVEATEIRHSQVDQRDIGVSRPQLGDGLSSTGAGNDFEPGTAREAIDNVTNSLLVIDDDEDRRLSGHTHSLTMARTAERRARS
jgi:hypothetical protein